MPDYKVPDELRQLLVVFVSEHYTRIRANNPGFEKEEAECRELLKLLQGCDTVLIVQKP
jgi:hypothetical protein